MRKNSALVSGYRFSDTVGSSKSDATSEAAEEVVVALDFAWRSGSPCDNWLISESALAAEVRLRRRKYFFRILLGAGHRKTTFSASC
jgi:hypothetical protein